MNRNSILLTTAFVTVLGGTNSTYAQQIQQEQRGDTTVLRIANPTKYLLLPIEEEKEEAKVLLDTGNSADTWMDVRLAQGRIDYYVPFLLYPQGKEAIVRILNLPHNATALQNLKLSDEWKPVNTDYYRPVYHHTPSYGWMNDANGLVYKDGEYHLYFQYNPYGSKWGNMHWGHSVSRDLVHWQELSPAIARDTLGHIFSGSSVVDFNNSAGYGKDAIIAFYTSHSEKNGQIQCMAYSTDNGRTYTKYEGNPILKPFDGIKDFRDPKVFWYAPQSAWYMIVSADKEMRFYRSTDLKRWDYVSAFGQGYGAQPNQFECPDFFPLSIDGQEKYVMIVNINPGCQFGGSATQYFIGEFDGKNFIPDTPKSTVKWLDFGKDHYATVTFSNTPGRVLAMPWISNWQYANVTPIQQYRGANGLPRELSLYRQNGQLYVAANVASEVKQLRRKTTHVSQLTVTAQRNKSTSRAMEDALRDTEGIFELEADLTTNDNNGKAGIRLYNLKGEEVLIYLDFDQQRLVMDRTKSGLIDFGNKATPHDIERNYDNQHKEKDGLTLRQKNSINYVNDFALGTWAPLNLLKGKAYHFDIYVDKCSVEIFVDGGRIAMTNLVFPTQPYTSAEFYTSGGKAKLNNIKIYSLH